MSHYTVSCSTTIAVLNTNSLINDMELNSEYSPPKIARDGFTTSEISEMFYNTVEYEQIRITEIEKLQDSLYDGVQLSLARTYMNKDEFEFKYLWHGTNVLNVKQIEANGFNRDFNKRSDFGEIKVCPVY